MKTNDDQVMADSSSNKNAPKPKLLPALCRIYVNTRKKNKKKVDVEEEEQQQQPPPPAEVMNLGSKQAQQEVVTNAIDTIPGASDVLIEGGESIGVVNVDQQTISEIGDNSAADQSMADGFVDYHAAASQCPPSFNYQVTLNQQHPSFVGSGSNTGYPVAVGASSSHDRPTE
ncbi:OLC1v1036843C1 [Oldenlandia corymbosa var. corymbosa]|uniref:OLC1v1036843C1 n=1 Tax=Oldenlandia corymbosa var. corymbosa TaxID=529605 RepID=A0AAV1CZI0_OLDCO|nr:OLC1v1036843C1 [Oldenlandia corymbosa var. corymbosa]